MRLLSAAIVLALLSAGGPALGKFERQVVSLSITYQTYDEDRPWAKSQPGNRIATAVVIEGNRLLTLSQMIADATLIRAERGGDGRLWAARVVHRDPNVNLALLTVDEPEFADGLRPVRFARALPTEGFLQAVRWKGRQLEVSTSRVARVEMAVNRYGNLQQLFLLVRTDIAAGGWSEPVFDDGRLVGLTSSQEEDQRASITPIDLIRTYVEGVDRGDYRGAVSLGLAWQQNRDRAYASYLGLESEPRGVVIRGARTGTSGCGVFQRRDVLLSLDGHDIDSVGNYEHSRYGRMPFPQIAREGVRPGDEISAQVLREGRVIDLAVALGGLPPEARLIPWRREDAPPPYLVAGGLVFRELDGNYLRTWGRGWERDAPLDLVRRYYLEGQGQRNGRRRIIVLSSVLPDDYNTGYHNARDLVVESVNAQPIDSISSLAGAFGQPRDGFHVIELAPNLIHDEIVLDAASFHEASDRILDAYGIPQALRVEPPSSYAFDLECDSSYP